MMLAGSLQGGDPRVLITTIRVGATVALGSTMRVMCTTWFCLVGDGLYTDSTMVNHDLGK